MHATDPAATAGELPTAASAAPDLEKSDVERRRVGNVRLYPWSIGTITQPLWSSSTSTAPTQRDSPP
jgi:hypothetical protein